MNKKIRLSLLLTLSLAMLSGCNGIGKLPGSGGSGGALTVQMVQAPPATIVAGQSVGLAANVLNDSKNGGVTWSCAPANACGTFSPTTTGYQIDTLYTAPAPTSPNTGTPALQAGQYAFVLEGFASYGIVGSITLDGNGNIVDGEADWSGNGLYCPIGELAGGPMTGTYAVDSSGHGVLTLNLNTGCFGTFTESHGITVTSSSHAIIVEEDQFNGATVGGVGSLDLQTTAPNFTAAQVTGGYSFTLTGFSSAAVKASGGTGLNGSWAGIFTADGVSGLTGGIFDASLAGGSPNYSSTPFTGSFTAPNAFGRGTLTFAGVDGGSNATYAYYIVTPEALRLTAGDQNTANFAGNTGSAWGQGSLSVAASDTTATLSGPYVFSNMGFDAPGNSAAAGGQFTADGSGNATAGIMDLNDSGNNGALTLGLSFAGSVYAISGSPRGTITGPSGQTYNVYLTDPTLNLLDVNNTSGGGGALLLETDNTFSMTGTLIPQTGNSSVTITATSVSDSSQSVSAPTVVGPAVLGGYALLLSDQSGSVYPNGGLSGQFTAPPSSGAVSFTGEGDYMGTGSGNVTPVVGPVSGTFTPDSNNAGRYTGTIVTPVGYPGGGGTNPTTEAVSLYVANQLQGFIIETDAALPVWGIIQLQNPSPSAAASANDRPIPGRQSHPLGRHKSKPLLVAH